MPKGIKGFQKGQKCKNWNGFRKNHISWSKGLTKETDERLKKLGEKESKTKKQLYQKGELVIWNKGKHIFVGKDNPMYGKKHTKIAKEKNRQKNLGRIAWNKGLTKKDKRVLKNISGGSKRTQFKKGHKQPLEIVIKALKNARKSMNLKPNKPENSLINLIKKNNLPFNYVGDGKIWFKGKNHAFNPDFLSKNPKHIIEVFGDYWHRNTYEKDKERLKTYAKYGYKTLVIWEHELILGKRYGKVLPEQEIINKIKSFIR